MAAEVPNDVPVAQKATWTTFLKSIASFSGDLSSLTAPPFILSPVSLAEFPSYWGEPTAQFAAIAGGKTPEERQLLVTEWYIATFSGQFTRREKETGSEKKPLNPILGEQFIGKWVGEEGETILQSEQVSHHPPVTAYFLENASKGVSLEGNNAQKTSFSGRTIVVKQVGHSILRVALADGTTESYLITFPKLIIEGLWFGRPYVELTDHSYIQASHGLTTSFKYVGKGYFSGKAHTFTATIGTGPAPSSPLFTIEGVWTGTSHFIKPSKHSEGKVFTEAGGERTPISCTEPIDAQGEFESRRVWKDVAAGIRKGDFDAASIAKTKLENAERQKRKVEISENKPFELRLFNKVSDLPEYVNLAQMAHHKPEKEDAYRYKGKTVA